ncbi:MAG: hypothetical protein ACW9XH_06275 [Candidatus Nitrosopumilus sp. bin_32a]
MTKTVTIAAILALSAGLLFAVPSAVEANHLDLWKDLDSATKSTKGNSLNLTVTADDVIPKDFPTVEVSPSKVVVGYAWLDAFDDNGDLRGDEISGFVTAIHPTFDDSNQNPHAWHSQCYTCPTPNTSSPTKFLYL